MKLVICDDEIKDAQKANEIISKMPCAKEFEIKMRTPQDVMIAVEEDLFKCDILVMDIQYDEEQYDGIELTQLVNEKLPACQIIYLTNILDFAPFVYDTNHCYFVMKENIEIMLPRAMDKAIEGYKTIGNDIIEFLSNGHKVFTSQSEIIYIERNDRVLNINTLKKTYPCYTSLRKIESKLGSSFARCHGGFIVNLAFVSGIDGTELYLKDGSKIPIGMRFFENFKMQYLKYYSDRM
ncbi:MAG: DNA-binding response regulator [Lachnospiraceae bacterium]|nr:DNA-binding response regulator [Lachnospiraceae bacterium]